MTCILDSFEEVNFVDVDAIVAKIEAEEEVEEFLKSDKENDEWN